MPPERFRLASAVHPAYVLWTLEHLAAGRVVNRITVDPETAREALGALDRMLAVP